MPVKTPTAGTKWFHMKQSPKRQHREDAERKAGGFDPVVYYWEAVAQTSDDEKISVETPDMNNEGQPCYDNGAGTGEWLSSVKPKAVQLSVLACYKALQKELEAAGYTGKAFIADETSGFDEGYNGQSMAYNRWLEAQKPTAKAATPAGAAK